MFLCILIMYIIKPKVAFHIHEIPDHAYAGILWID